MSNKLLAPINKSIGPRTILKSLSISLKTGQGLSSRFLVNGKTRVYLGKNVKIVNNGMFVFGFRAGGPFAPVVVNQQCVFQMFDNSKLILNGNVNTSPGVAIKIGENATLEIGSNVWLNSSSKIICFSQVKIGDNTIVGWEAEICDKDFHVIKYPGSDDCDTKPITIGRHVWIGKRAMIMKNIEIGDGSVIAAGAVVTHDVPEGCLAAGVPAKVIRQNVTWF